MPNTSNILPIHIACGENEFKREEVIRRLKQRIEQDDDLSFDFDEFDANLVSAADVCASCQCFPVLAQKRLVILHHLETYKKDDLALLSEYAQHPCETTILLLEGTKLAKNTKLYKAISQLGKNAVIPCDIPKGEELVSFVVALSEREGVAFSRPAAKLIIDFVGQNTAYLHNEINKVCSMCSDKSSIEVSDVLELVNNTAESKAWQFLEPFSSRNITESLQWLHEANGVSVYVLIPYCYQRLSELLCLRCLQEEGRAGSFASELGLSSGDAWKIKHHQRYASRFTKQELMAGMSSLRDCELAVKTGAQPEHAFQDWVLRFLSK